VVRYKSKREIERNKFKGGKIMKVVFETMKDGTVQVKLQIAGMNQNTIAVFETMERATAFVIEVMKTQGMP
jgi:hypothetical protein